MATEEEPDEETDAGPCLELRNGRLGSVLTFFVLALAWFTFGQLSRSGRAGGGWCTLLSVLLSAAIALLLWPVDGGEYPVPVFSLLGSDSGEDSRVRDLFGRLLLLQAVVVSAIPVAVAAARRPD